MPDYADISGPIHCPFCGKHYGDEVDIAWGKVPYSYKVGDAIKWKRHRDGELVEPYTMDEGQRTWNCGYPELRNLLVFDCRLFYPEEDFGCDACRGRLAGAVAHIQDGVVIKTELLKAEETRLLLGQHLGRADTIEIKKDGSKVIREDLYDPPVTYRFRKR